MFERMHKMHINALLPSHILMDSGWLLVRKTFHIAMFIRKVIYVMCLNWTIHEIFTSWLNSRLSSVFVSDLISKKICQNRRGKNAFSLVKLTQNMQIIKNDGYFVKSRQIFAFLIISEKRCTVFRYDNRFACQSMEKQ